MADRVFSRIRKQDKGGKVVTAFTIKCSECGSEGEMTQRSIRNLPSIAVEQYFRNHGWVVANRPAKDTCPTCVMKARRPKLEIVAMEKTPMTGAISIPTKAEPPRKMSREDRRIVYAKIEDTYDVKGSCYDEDWTDQKVATDLGVPRAWVSEIREEFFGPEIDAATAARRAEIADLRGILGDLENRVRGVQDAMALARSRLDKLEDGQ